jgi:hypothetical protein
MQLPPAARFAKGCLHMGLPAVMALQTLALPCLVVLAMGLPAVLALLTLALVVPCLAVLAMGLLAVLSLQALALAAPSLLVLVLLCCQWAPSARLVLAMASIPGRCIARMTGNRRRPTPLGGSA